jgi:hypothetical protein
VEGDEGGGHEERAGDGGDEGGGGAEAGDQRAVGAHLAGVGVVDESIGRSLFGSRAPNL